MAIRQGHQQFEASCAAYSKLDQVCIQRISRTRDPPAARANVLSLLSWYVDTLMVCHEVHRSCHDDSRSGPPGDLQNPGQGAFCQHGTQLYRSTQVLPHFGELKRGLDPHVLGALSGAHSCTRILSQKGGLAHETGVLYGSLWRHP